MGACVNTHAHTHKHAHAHLRRAVAHDMPVHKHEQGAHGEDVRTDAEFSAVEQQRPGHCLLHSPHEALPLLCSTNPAAADIREERAWSGATYTPSPPPPCIHHGTHSRQRRSTTPQPPAVARAPASTAAIHARVGTSRRAVARTPSALLVAVAFTNQAPQPPPTAAIAASAASTSPVSRAS